MNDSEVSFKAALKEGSTLDVTLHNVFPEELTSDLTGSWIAKRVSETTEAFLKLLHNSWGTGRYILKFQREDGDGKVTLRKHAGPTVGFELCSFPSCCALDILHTFYYRPSGGADLSRVVCALLALVRSGFQSLVLSDSEHNRYIINLVHSQQDDDFDAVNWDFDKVSPEVVREEGEKHFPEWHAFVSQCNVESSSLHYNPNSGNIVETVIFRLPTKQYNSNL